jgi:hypothetical protein
MSVDLVMSAAEHDATTAAMMTASWEIKTAGGLAFPELRRYGCS